MTDSNSHAEPTSPPPPWDDSLPKVLQGDDIDYRKMWICGDCLELKGWCWYDGRWLDQPCSQECREKKGDSAPSLRWEKFDFNEAVTLCYCCGAELLRSGLRWSVWFCPECKDRVIEINRFLQTYWIPIGRHSIMSGCARTPDGISYRNAAERRKLASVLARQFKPMFGRIERVSDMAHEAIADNLKSLGIEREADISLASYMRSVQTAKIDKKRQFMELCYRMHIPWLEVCKFEMWKKQSEQESPGG